MMRERIVDADRHIAAHQQMMETVFRTLPADMAGLYRAFMAEECFTPDQMMEFCLTYMTTYIGEMEH